MSANGGRTEIFMNEFKTYHPIVNFTYFVLVIGFSMFFMHPLCLAISLACGFVYSVMLKGKKAVKTNIAYMLPMLILTAVINPVFNHEGMTVITYFPNGNPLTLESVIYGLCAASMLAAVICHFSCFNEIMTSDKLIYLFGKITPSLSLIISMTLRFVPRFTSQLKITADAQKCMGKGVSDGSVIKRAKHGLNILSAMATYSLENAVETADSMKSRGFGLKDRTAFSVFAFDRRDKTALIAITALGAYTFIGKLCSGMYFRFFPSVKGAEISPYGISVFISYLLLCMCPVIIEIREVLRWNVLKSKI